MCLEDRVGPRCKQTDCQYETPNVMLDLPSLDGCEALQFGRLLAVSQMPLPVVNMR